MDTADISCRLTKNMHQHPLTTFDSLIINNILPDAYSP